VPSKGLFARAPVLGLRFFVSVKRSTLTQQPTIPWSSLLQHSPRQCRTLQLSNRVGETTRNYHVVCRILTWSDPMTARDRFEGRNAPT